MPTPRFRNFLRAPDCFETLEGRSKFYEQLASLPDSLGLSAIEFLRHFRLAASVRRTKRKKGGERRSWLDAEDYRKLVELTYAGRSAEEIALALRCSAHTVYNQWIKLRFTPALRGRIAKRSPVAHEILKKRLAEFEAQRKERRGRGTRLAR